MTAVTVIVPALDSAATIGRCLDAIEVTSGSGVVEVLVLDNGSVDDTATIARRHGARVVTVPDRTVAALRNRGASMARGEIVAYVDADCVVAADWLEVALPHFDDPRVAAVGAPTTIPEHTTTWVQRAWALHRHRANRAGPVAWLPTENLLVRRAALLEIGGFNETLVTCEDADLCYRLGAGGAIVNEPRLRAVHLGEAPTLGRFFLKEAWRGRGNLRGFFAHALRPSEIPSLAFPLYYLLGGAAFVLAVGYAWMRGRPLIAMLAGFVLLAPAAGAALVTAVITRSPRAWPQLTVLYLVYAAARAATLVPVLGDRLSPSRSSRSDSQTRRDA